MSQSNLFAPPHADLADLPNAADVDIDRLEVSDKWKQRFKWLKRAGGPAMKNLNNLPKEDRAGFNNFFNVLAFLFGPLYYICKGMWKKAITLFIVLFAAIFVLEVVMRLAGIGSFTKYLGYGAAAVFASRANIDYYKKMVLDDNGWW